MKLLAGGIIIPTERAVAPLFLLDDLQVLKLVQPPLPGRAIISKDDLAAAISARNNRSTRRGYDKSKPPHAID